MGVEGWRRKRSEGEEMHGEKGMDWKIKWRVDIGETSCFLVRRKQRKDFGE